MGVILSPTYLFANFRKKDADRRGGAKGRARRIIAYNHRYLASSILSTLFWGLTRDWSNYPIDKYRLVYSILIAIYIWLLPLSRCNEIFYAFIRDAMDKVGHKEAHSTLSFQKRIELSLYSYVELLINFAIIYYILPSCWFKGDTPFSTIIDSIYFSGVTITTLGYGDYFPSYWIPKLLVVYEVFCGFILLIVSFAIYAGRGLNNKKGV